MRRLVLAELNVAFFDSVLRNSPDVVVVHVRTHLNCELMGVPPPPSTFSATRALRIAYEGVTLSVAIVRDCFRFGVMDPL